MKSLYSFSLTDPNCRNHQDVVYWELVLSRIYIFFISKFDPRITGNKYRCAVSSAEREISELGSNSCKICCIDFSTDVLGNGTNPSLLPPNYELNSSINWSQIQGGTQSRKKGFFGEGNEKPLHYLSQEVAIHRQ